MIVRLQPNLTSLLFTMHGSIVPRILPALLVLALFTLVVVLLQRFEWVVMPTFSLAPFTILGLALSLFLGFRNQAAYDRWWEARKLWGDMVYEIRGLARSSETLLALEAEQGEAGQLRRQLLSWVAAHSHALRGALRKEDCRAAMAPWLSEAEIAHMLTHDNPADYCLRRAGRLIGALYRGQHIDSIGLRILDEHLSELARVQAACERIANTPLPFAFTLLTHRTALIYCYTLPFVLVAPMGFYTILFTLLVAYTFFGLDVLSQELEGPFGREANDLPLDALCRVNEISIAESLGQPAPPQLQPVGFILQ